MLSLPAGRQVEKVTRGLYTYAMRYSKLFGKTVKDVPADEVAINAKLLIQAGFIRREVAGVYNLLPLGFRVLNKISQIVREEMDSTGAQELLLSSLQNKESWLKTKRWETFDALFKLKSRHDHEYGLGPSHEEVLVPLVGQFISSYKDLPLSLYQIQTKFRDEARAKSGILRGREFLMKDLYSFHTTEVDFEEYYKLMRKTYMQTFKKLGLDAIETEASGGAFSEFSHEYQVLTEAGEDEIIYCPGGDFSANTEVAKVKEGKECDLGHGKLQKAKAIEVGNIFPLKTKFSDAFSLTFKNEAGEEVPVIMGCYGIGITRLMGTIVEVHHDDNGIVWPENVAPFTVHLLDLGSESADDVYSALQKHNVEVLFDDRDVRAGEKFADADLIGLPYRFVVSSKAGDGMVEVKKRTEEKSEVMPLAKAIELVKQA